MLKTLLKFAKHSYYLLQHFKHFLRMCDCSTRVFHNTVTALLGYLNIFMIAVLEYLNCCHTNFTKFSIYFSKISPNILLFTFIISLFQKKLVCPCKHHLVKSKLCSPSSNCNCMDTVTIIIFIQ